MKIDLTPAELEVALWAIGMQTLGNANDIDEMMLCGMSRTAARALLRAEDKLQTLLRAKKRRALVRP